MATQVTQQDQAPVRIDVARADEVDEAGPLFQEMVEHHRAIAGGEWPVRDAAAAWELRRRQYTQWLGAPGAWMLLARRERTAVGYAVLRLDRPGPTWALGEVLAELESLSVTSSERGRGVGAALVAAARELAREAGARHWLVAVVDANEAALRFYEREGFRPYYRQLLAAL